MINRQIIIHVDMDAFYASVETRDDPSLRGKPLIIGALPSERGVVSTCSYEARKYGVHSTIVQAPERNLWSSLFATDCSDFRLSGDFADFDENALIPSHTYPDIGF
jgi:nucleotidyltransferase/DNA polymerase involved in DNA repair